MKNPGYPAPKAVFPQHAGAGLYRLVRRLPFESVLMDKHTPPALLSVREAMARLSVSRAGLYTLLGQGRLQALKLGSRTLIPATELERFVADLPVATFAGAAR